MFTKFILKTMFNQGPRIRVSFLILVLLFTLTGFHPAQAAGLTYYVDKTNPSCSDNGTGLTTAFPFCTIGKGASVAIAGDTVRVLAGTYGETVSIPKSGSTGLPITYTAMAGIVVTGNGNASGGNAFLISNKSYVIIDGFTVTGTADNGIYVSGSTAITISNNHVNYSGKPVSGSTRAGIYLTGTTYSTITANTTDHNSQDGITLRNSSSNNTVSNNVSFANAEGWQRNATGIHLNGSGSYNNTIIHNITYANEDTGLQFYSGAHDNIVVGNLSYGNGDHGIDNLNSPNNIAVGNTIQGNQTAGMNFEGSSSGSMIMGNISVDNGIAPITGQKSNIRVDSNSIAGTSMDYNLVYLSGAGTSVIQWNGTNYSTLAAFQRAVPGQEVHGLQANPLFVSPVPYVATRPPAVVVGDYHIQAGSPAIDSANSNAPYEPLTDIEGKPRVDDPATTNTGAGVRAYDERGAYEYQSGLLVLPAVTTQAVTVITTASATGNGNITDLGVPALIQHGVVWSTAPNPTTSDSKTLDGPVSATGAFTSSITGLTPSILYHVRAYATNAAGTAYGEDVTFTTSAAPVARTLTLNKVGNGTLTVDPPAPYYDGEAVTLTVAPDPGWSFSGWSGAVSGMANPLTITINGDMALTATFTQDLHTLTVTVNGSGSVTKSPDQSTYHYGDSVQLTTASAANWSFTGWSGDASGTANPLNLTINGNMAVTATFMQNAYTLTINPVGNGTVTAAPTGPYYNGEVVTLTAAPDPGWSFTGWSGAASGSVNPLTITINGNMTVAATFMQNVYTLMLNKVGSGTVAAAPTGPYYNGEAVTLTAVPDPGWSFAGWSGDAGSTTNPLTITVNGNMAVAATFTQNQYTLTVNVNGSGTVTKSPDQSTYHLGDVVQLTPTPAADWSFTGWSGDAGGKANPLSLTVNGNTVVTATFIQNEYTLTLNTVGSGTITAAPTGPYHNGDVVMLTATPNLGWNFTSWSGNVVDGKVIIEGNTTVTATFTPIDYTLTITTNPTGGGTVSANSNSTTVHYGDVVTLTAIPSTGWNFSGWSGDASGTVNPLNITITGNLAVTATFVQIEYTLTLNTVGSGTITTDRTGPYHYGDVVTLTAVPAAGWHFDSWSGGASGPNNPVIVTMSGNTIVTATFLRDPLNISGNAGAEGVTLTCSNGGCNPGSSATDGSYSVTVPYNWTGTLTPNKAGFTFTPASRSYRKISANQTGQNFTATPAKRAIPVTISPSGTTNDTTPTFTWTASDPVYRVTSYILSIYNSNTRTYLPNINVDPLSSCSGGTCTYTPTQTLAYTNYKFAVAAVNSTGSSGFPSLKTWLSFTIAP